MADESIALPPVRRVVTGHTAAGIATVLIDGEATNAKAGPTGELARLIWSSDETPADIGIGTDVEDFGARILGTAPPPCGSRFAVIDLPPRTEGHFHRSETLDYLVVLSGTIELKLDDTAVILGTGDMIVQRGTYHSWINRTSTPARMAYVILDAKPLALGDGRPAATER